MPATAAVPHAGGFQADAFRAVMASFPSGVTIVTTTDENGRWWGFTATSFCSVSLDPPLVLVCLATTAECHPVFERAQRWVVHVIHPGHTELALRFATRGAEKFGETGFVEVDGMPALADASAALFCSTHARHPAGDHTILVGCVEAVRHDPLREPAIYYQRSFRTL